MVSQVGASIYVTRASAGASSLVAAGRPVTGWSVAFATNRKTTVAGLATSTTSGGAGKKGLRAR